MSQINDNLIVCLTAFTSTGLQVSINGTSLLWVHWSQGESNIKPFPCHGVIIWWKYIFIGPSMIGAEETSGYHLYGITQNRPDPWWRHQMEPFPLYWPFVWGIHQSPVNSPHKGQWRGTLMFSLICAWTNGWVNNRDAADLRRYRDHYDVTVLTCGSLERTAIVTSKSIVEWNIFRVRVGLGAGWVDMYFIWYIILL